VAGFSGLVRRLVIDVSLFGDVAQTEDHFAIFWFFEVNILGNNRVDHVVI